MAKRIARAIVTARLEAPIETTSRLVEVIHSVKRSRPHEIHPATLTFQALRIAANAELIDLDRFVHDAVSVAKSGARVAIIDVEEADLQRALAVRRLHGGYHADSFNAAGPRKETGAVC